MTTISFCFTTHDQAKNIMEAQFSDPQTVTTEKITKFTEKLIANPKQYHSLISEWITRVSRLNNEEWIEEVKRLVAKTPFNQPKMPH